MLQIVRMYRPNNSWKPWATIYSSREWFLRFGQIWNRATENLTGFPLCVERHTRPSLLSFCSTALTAKKTFFFSHTRFFRTLHLTAATSPRLTGHGSWQNLEVVCFTHGSRALDATFWGPYVGGRCLGASLVTWGPDRVLYQLFVIQNKRSFAIRKNI